MSKRSILIFGGGDNQITLIKSAKERGYFTVVIDPDKNAIGKSIADAFENAAPKDFEATCKIVEKYNVKGIATAQMENPLLLMAQVSEKYNFIFPSVEQIKTARNKFLMKQAFIREDVSCANGKLFHKMDEITKASIADFQFPLIIKPVDAFSSRGVFKVNDFEELKRFESESRKFSSDGSVIIEEFIEGPEYSIESITHKGKTHIIQYTEKIITSYPHTVEMGHIQPAELPEEAKKLISIEVKKAIAAIGLENTACHTELKLTKAGPVIIELGARLGGDHIASYLTLHSTGVNMDAAAADIAMGENPDLEQKLNQYSGIFYFHLGEGKKITSINGWQIILENSEVLHAAIIAKPGETIPALTDSSKRSGFVILKNSSKKVLLKKAKYYIDKFQHSLIVN